jgi:hypothetical protein
MLTKQEEQMRVTDSFTRQGGWQPVDYLRRPIAPTPRPTSSEDALLARRW